MKQLKDITLQPYTIIPVETESSAEIVLSTRDTIADFVSLGTICLYKSITGDTDTTIKITKSDFSEQEGAIIACLGNKEISVPHDAFTEIACKYSETITDYIAEKKFLNHMILGFMTSQALSLYMLGEDIGLGTEPHLKSMLRGILPIVWDMADTVEAQKIAFTLLQKMFEVTIALFEI